jgi:hypothetical protein
MSDSAFERILSALDERGRAFDSQDERTAVVQCPAHDDGRPSLIVTNTRGRALIHCRANCPTEKVLDALGMTKRDLFDSDRGVSYVYEDDRTVHRSADKRFYQSGETRGERSVLYRLSEVRRAVSEGRTVYLVEGEQDADSVASVGGVATTAPGGASNFGKVDESPLAGALVVAIPDQDEAGEGWAKTVRAKLANVAGSLRFAAPAAGKDFTDHLAAGYGIDDLLIERTAMDKLEALLVDTDGLENIPEPDPIVDGLLYRDSLAWIFGAPASGKSFVALDIAGCVGGGHKWHAFQAHAGTVLYLVAEGVSGVKRRVRAWEDYYGRKMTGVRFLPVAVQAASADSWGPFVELVAKYRPAMVIVDTQARVTEGMDENSNSEMGQLVGRLDELRRASGACVLTVHHTGRNGEHMRGAIALDGAATTIVKAQKKRGEDVVTLECFKQKDAAPFDDIQLVLTPHETSAILKWQGVSSAPTVSSEVIHKALVRWWNAFGDAWASGPQLKGGSNIGGESRDSDSIILHKSTFYMHIQKLIFDGTVEKGGTPNRPTYRLVKSPLTTVPDSVRTVRDSRDAGTVRTVPPPYRADGPDTASDGPARSHVNKRRESFCECQDGEDCIACA